MARTKIDSTGEAHTELTTTEARQGTRRGVIWVLSISLALVAIAGLLLGFGWISLPWS